MPTPANKEERIETIDLEEPAQNDLDTAQGSAKNPKKKQRVAAKAKSQEPQGDEVGDMWKEAAKYGFATRGPKVANRFNRDTEGGLDPRYKQLTDGGEKARFRKEWAEKKYDNYQATKTKTEEEKHTQRDLGRYLNVASLCWEKGMRGADAALDRAAKVKGMQYIARCRQLGGDWMRQNPIDDDEEFLYMSAEREHVFVQAWADHVVSWGDAHRDNELGKGEGKGSSSSPSGSGSQRALGIPTKGKGKGNAEVPHTALPPPPPKDEPTNPPPPKDEKDLPPAKAEMSEFDKVIKDAKSVQNMYNDAILTTQTILGLIDNRDSHWVWVTDTLKPSLLAPLLTAQREMHIAVDNFTRRFFADGVKVLMKEMTKATLHASSKTMTDTLKPKVDAVNKEVGILQRMSASRSTKTKESVGSGAKDATKKAKKARTA